jgi:hypothetical protein
VIPHNKDCACSNRIRSAIAIILISLFSSVLPGSICAQTNLDFDKLKTRVETLHGRIVTLETALERVQDNVICGRIGPEVLKDNIYIHPTGCFSISVPSLASYKGPTLKVTLMRLGIFRFEFASSRPQKPIVLATALKTWGDVPVEAPILRVTNVSQSGFTVETFDAAADMNPTNVGFYFVVLGESPSR